MIPMKFPTNMVVTISEIQISESGFKYRGRLQKMASIFVLSIPYKGITWTTTYVLHSVFSRLCHMHKVPEEGSDLQ